MLGVVDQTCSMPRTWQNSVTRMKITSNPRGQSKLHNSANSLKLCYRRDDYGIALGLIKLA